MCGNDINNICTFTIFIIINHECLIKIIYCQFWCFYIFACLFPKRKKIKEKKTFHLKIIPLKPKPKHYLSCDITKLCQSSLWKQEVPTTTAARINLFDSCFLTAPVFHTTHVYHFNRPFHISLLGSLEVHKQFHFVFCH